MRAAGGTSRSDMAIDDMRAVAPQQIKDVVYERLREALVDLTFAPGEPLREAALGKSLGVSKTPIREALVRLESDGLVELAPYRGARARSYSADDLRELFEAREIIEGECVRRAARCGDQAFKDALRANIDATEKAYAKGDLARTAAMLDQFDELMFGQLRNHMLDDVLDRLRTHLRRIGRISASIPGRADASVPQHAAIADAVLAGRPAGAERELRRHLLHVLEDHIDRLEARRAAESEEASPRSRSRRAPDA
jgi:DNA-binding GntR family transcriptional regulator